MKSALIQELQMWKNSRKRFTVAAVAVAVVCALSEWVFFLCAWLIFVSGFVSCAAAFNVKNQPVAEEYKKSLPVDSSKSIAAKYIVLLGEAAVYCVLYAVACAFTDITVIDAAYADPNYFDAMAKGAVLLIGLYVITFVIVFVLNCKIKRGRVLINVVLLIPLALLFMYANMEIVFLANDSIFSTDLWRLPALVLTALLMLVFGYAAAAWAVTGKSCGRKFKITALVCVAAVPLVCVSLSTLDEYNYFGENAPLGFIYSSSEESDDDLYMLNSVSPATQENLAERENLLELMGEICLETHIGMPFDRCVSELKAAGFIGSSSNGASSLYKGSINCIVCDDSNIYTDIIAQQNNAMNGTKKTVSYLSITADTGSVYYETAALQDIEALTAAFEACTTEAELHKAFAETEAVPQGIVEISHGSGETAARHYALSGFIENYEGSGSPQSFLITVITVEQKVTAVEYTFE